MCVSASLSRLSNLGSVVWEDPPWWTPDTTEGREEQEKVFHIYHYLYAKHGVILAHTFKMLYMGVAFPSHFRQARYSIISHLGDGLADDVHVSDVERVIHLVRVVFGVRITRSRAHGHREYVSGRSEWYNTTTPATYGLSDFSNVVIR